MITHAARAPWLVALSLPIFALGCAGAGPSVAPEALIAAHDLPSIGNVDSSIPRWRLTVDPVTEQMSLHSLNRTTAANTQAKIYDLDPQQFLTADSLRLMRFRVDVDGDYVFTFRHAHPFPPPTLSVPEKGSAANRADLGYTGWLLQLSDVASADIATSTFFGNVIANTKIVKNPDVYVSPGDLLLGSPTFNATVFPAMLLANETLGSQGNRVGISNSGTAIGNYAPASGGWQRNNLGINATSPAGTPIKWTGYDFLHGGQVVDTDLTLSAKGIGTSGGTFDLALLIKYTDAKSAPGRTDKALFLPQNPTDVLKFAYRLPFAALDCSQIKVSSMVNLDGTTGGISDVSVRVRDWDATAAQSGGWDLSAEPSVAKVQAGAAGLPTVSLSSPAISASTFSLSAIGTHSGRPGDELEFLGTITNELGTSAPGLYPALIRVRDPEASLTNLDMYHFGVDPAFLTSHVNRRLEPVTYQALTINLGQYLPFIQLTPETMGSVLPHQTSITVGQSAIVIAYERRGSGEGKIRIACSNSLNPKVQADWNSYTLVDTGVNKCHLPHVTATPTGFGITYLNQTDNLTFQATSSASPVSASWGPQQVFTTITNYQPGGGAPLAQPKIAWLNDRFAIGYGDETVVGKRRPGVMFALNSDPQLPSHWRSVLATTLTSNLNYRGIDLAVRQNQLLVVASDTSNSGSLRWAVTQPGGIPVDHSGWLDTGVVSQNIGDSSGDLEEPVAALLSDGSPYAAVLDREDGVVRAWRGSWISNSITWNATEDAPPVPSGMDIPNSQYALPLAFTSGCRTPVFPYYTQANPVKSLSVAYATIPIPTQASHWKSQRVNPTLEGGKGVAAWGNSERLLLSYYAENGSLVYSETPATW